MDHECVLSHVQPRTVAHQALLSMEFFRHEYQSGLSCPLPGDHPDPGIEPASPEVPVLAVDSVPLEPPGNLPRGGHQNIRRSDSGKHQ